MASTPELDDIISAYAHPTQEHIKWLRSKIGKRADRYTDQQMVEICQANAVSMQKAQDGVPGYGSN